MRREATRRNNEITMIAEPTLSAASASTMNAWETDASPALLEQRAQLCYRLADAMLRVRAEEETLTNATAMMGMSI